MTSPLHLRFQVRHNSLLTLLLLLCISPAPLSSIPSLGAAPRLNGVAPPTYQGTQSFGS